MRTRTRITLAGLALGAALAGGVAWATIPADSGLYTACKLKATGTIRLIDPVRAEQLAPQPLHDLETQITWNQKGLKGDPGTAGVNGANGAAGKDGAAGPKGADGADGTNGDTGAVGRRRVREGPQGPKRRRAGAHGAEGRLRAGAGFRAPAGSAARTVRIANGRTDAGSHGLDRQRGLRVGMSHR